LPGIRRIILDVDVPSNVPLVELAQQLSSVPGVRAINLTVTDTDVDVLGLVIVVEGDDIDYRELQGSIEKMGGAIRSIDQVVAGEYILDLGIDKVKERG
jgi:hypothetical protein